MWMINQADKQGIKFITQTIKDNQWDVVSNPELHDKSSNLISGAPDGGPAATSEDRDVIYGDGTVVKERQATSGTMAYANTVPFITYKADPLTSDYISGTVDANAYLQWLNAHGYGINNITVQ